MKPWGRWWVGGKYGISETIVLELLLTLSYNVLGRSVEDSSYLHALLIMVFAAIVALNCGLFMAAIGSVLQLADRIGRALSPDELTVLERAEEALLNAYNLVHSLRVPAVENAICIRSRNFATKPCFAISPRDTARLLGTPALRGPACAK